MAGGAGPDELKRHVLLQDLTPKLDGHLVTRVAMGVDVLAKLHQQIQHVLVRLRDARQPKAKG